MPIREAPEKWDGNSVDGKYKNEYGYKFDVLKQEVVVNVEHMLECFLADTVEEAQRTYDAHKDMLNGFAYTYSISTGIERADLFGEALIGLARAKRDWDSRRSENFKTYAIFRVKDALSEFVRDNASTISVPSYIKKANTNLNKLKTLCDRYNVNYMSIIEKGVIPDKFNDASSIECKKIVRNIESAARRAGVRCDKFVMRVSYVPEDIEYNNQEAIDSHERSQQILEAAMLVEQLKKCMDDDELNICEGIMEDKTYEEIGKDIGKSASWVSNKLKGLKKKVLLMM